MKIKFECDMNYIGPLEAIALLGGVLKDIKKITSYQPVNRDPRSRQDRRWRGIGGRLFRMEAPFFC